MRLCDCISEYVCLAMVRLKCRHRIWDRENEERYNMEKVISGVNDLKTWCENNNRNDLLKEWDYVNNKA